MDRRRFLKRLLTPPIPGEGVLFVGAITGLLGWSATIVIYQFPTAAVVGTLTTTLVGLWVLLTGVVVGAMLIYAAPTVRRATVWIVWAVLNFIATGVNVLALLRALPPQLLQYAFIHPWFAVLGAGYLTTAFANLGNPRLRRVERASYALGGVASLLTLAGLFSGAIAVQTALVAGLCLHVLPMGFDILIDVLQLRHHG